MHNIRSVLPSNQMIIELYCSIGRKYVRNIRFCL